MQADLEEKIRASVGGAVDAKMDDIRREISERVQAECAGLIDSQLEAARSAAAVKARAETVEILSEAVHRIRSEESVSGIALALVESASRFAGRCALFIHKDEGLLAFRVAGDTDSEKQSAFESLKVPLGNARALAHAVETRDAVVSGGSANELSQEVVDLFALRSEDRIHLFPVVLREKVLAVLSADPAAAGHEVERPAIETLVSLAEAWLEAVGTRKKPVPQAEEAAV
jgi:hypothetical protein